MALRVLNYITNFYMDFLVNNRGINKLPAVFPIVLYNGERALDGTGQPFGVN